MGRSLPLIAFGLYAQNSGGSIYHFVNRAIAIPRPVFFLLIGKPLISAAGQFRIFLDIGLRLRMFLLKSHIYFLSSRLIFRNGNHRAVLRHRQQKGAAFLICNVLRIIGKRHLRRLTQLFSWFLCAGGTVFLCVGIIALRFSCNIFFLLFLLCIGLIPFLCPFLS